MILLLNYLPILIIAFGLYMCYRATIKYRGTDKVGKSVLMWLAITVLSVFTLRIVSTSYIAKPVGDRLETPSIEQLETKAEEAPAIRDIQRKPVQTAEQSKKSFDEMVDWRKHKAEREQKSTETQELPLPPPQ